MGLVPPPVVLGYYSTEITEATVLLMVDSEMEVRRAYGPCRRAAWGQKVDATRASARRTAPQILRPGLQRAPRQRPQPSAVRTPAQQPEPALRRGAGHPPPQEALEAGPVGPVGPAQGRRRLGLAWHLSRRRSRHSARRRPALRQLWRPCPRHGTPRPEVAQEPRGHLAQLASVARRQGRGRSARGSQCMEARYAVHNPPSGVR